MKDFCENESVLYKKKLSEYCKGRSLCEFGLEKSLLEKNSCIKSIFFALADALIRVDKEGRYLDLMIKEGEDLVFVKKELIKKTTENFFPESVAKKIKEAVTDVLKDRKTISNEYKFSVAESLQWVEVHLSWLSEQEVIVIVKNITEKKVSEEKIHYLSYHDMLTGLHNRAYFEEVLEEIDKKKNLPISVIMADTNGLKLVNDTYGHFIGDNMLKICSDVLKESCRINDIVSRWGGDEFIILLPKTSKREAEKIATRISSSAAYVENIPISMTIGVSTKRLVREDFNDVIRKAEERMYSKKIEESKSARDAVIESLIVSLGEKSYETREHIYRMQKLGNEMAKRIGLPLTEIERLNSAILIHDIGEINISKEILLKKDPLSKEDREIINKHPEFSYRIARSTDSFSYVAEDILSHHERWDGKGYPRRLKGDQITLLARIISIIDAYDVMRSERCYKKEKSEEDIITELRSCSGKQFDPDLVDLFISILKERK